MTEQQARALISRLTLEEKLSLKAMLENLEKERGRQRDEGADETAVP